MVWNIFLWQKMPEKLTNLLDVRKSAYFDPLKDISWCHLLRYIKIKDIFGTSRSKHYIIFIKHDCTMHLNESIMRKWENTGQNRPFFGHIKFYVFLYFAATISSLTLSLPGGGSNWPTAFYSLNFSKNLPGNTW